MAITRSGNVFVSDGYKNSRVVHFDRSGRFVKAWLPVSGMPAMFDQLWKRSVTCGVIAFATITGGQSAAIGEYTFERRQPK